LRGKVLNVEKAGLAKLLDNAEIKAIITAVGTGIRDEFDLQKLRYHKLIIMADADIDGAHIRTLIMTFFFRYLRALIEHGYLYIAKPPLYQVTQGKKSVYLYSDNELEGYRAQNDSNFSLKRFKGLGEMNPQELWTTTMSPEHRILKKVEVRDALEADEVFSTLMGSDVSMRRDFISENSDKITSLDI
jgi:DNA gyrase subunit B